MTSKLEGLEKKIRSLQLNRSKELKPEALLFFINSCADDTLTKEMLEGIDIGTAQGLNELYRRGANIKEGGSVG